MRNLQKRNTLSERCLLALTVGCILAYLGTFALLNIRGFALFCDTDMYGDTLVSKMMWEQKTLFPQGWIFGNQLYTIATPVLAALFYGITGNTNSAMILATEVMTLLTILSFVYLMGAFTREPLIHLVGCLLLMASIIAPGGPYSFHAQLFFLQASYYACYIITLFVVFGDYTRSFQSGKLRIPMWSFCLFLSFATGMQSLRQTVVMVLPILACEVFLFLRRLIFREAPFGKEHLLHFLRAASYAAANVAGVQFVKLLNIPQRTIYGSVKVVPLEDMGARLIEAWSAFKELCNLTFSSENYLYLGIFCFFCLLLAAVAIILWLSRIRHQEDALELSWLLCFVGILGVVSSSVLLTVYIRPIYMFTWFPMVALSGIMILKRLSPIRKQLAALLICLASLGNLYCSYQPYVEMTLFNPPSQEEQMCRWAMDEGYEYVYGDWYSAPIVATYSGGQLDAGFWLASNPYYALGFTNATNIYGEEENEKAIYVFLSRDEEDGLLKARERGITMTKVANFGELTAYTSPEPLVIAPSQP